MKSWIADLKAALTIPVRIILFFYFHYGLVTAISDASGERFLGGDRPLTFLAFSVFGAPLLIWGSVKLLNAMISAPGCADAPQVSARLRAAFLSASILLALFLYWAALVRPHGLWVVYSYIDGFAGHSFAYQSYKFLPMTALPRIGLLLTTYIGHRLALRCEPRSAIWLAASHAPLLAVYALLWAHEDWVPKPAAG